MHALKSIITFPYDLARPFAEVAISVTHVISATKKSIWAFSDLAHSLYLLCVNVSYPVYLNILLLINSVMPELKCLN